MSSCPSPSDLCSGDDTCDSVAVDQINMDSAVDRRGNGFRRRGESARDACLSPADVQILTSDGRCIPAHSGVLASSSPVLDRMLDRARKGGKSERIVHILGATHGSVLAFVRFLYSSRSGGMTAGEAAEAIERHDMPLLALSHAYRVHWLKRRCEAGVAAWVSAARAVDTLKLASLCDAPRLYQRCLALVEKEFAAVQRSEGWRFLQIHDPAMELEILQFLQDREQRKKRWRRERADQTMFRQLSEAMDCLHHICTEGCTDVGPHDSRPTSSPCTSFSTCEGLQLLIRHFATCGRKLTPNGCTHCKRMSQLFRLHSSLCHRPEPCRIPLCKQFKKKMEEDKVDKTWRLLVKKVAVASVMASLVNRGMPGVVQNSWLRYRQRR